ncbi:TIGR02285 family protein [Agarivorans gilvus]|uniref:Solute-binding protein family 3/N-terminal domain-containing protein n=1 Tax=Agarivorans gilvus TaxID=680279 RepID=A0ABQ1I0R8_9ALTE|nr:TIGR02285 family protein [Agarivorans gilvus]GGB00547.1 hypothetical protein GCM10007414_12100 [Agarivorans gilvus]
MKRFRFCRVMISLVILPALSKASETIVWYSLNFSPAFIVEGPYQNQGYLDLVQKEIVKALPTYHHVYKQGNFARIIKEMQTDDNVCSVSLLKTPEREQFIEYSIAHSLILANSLIVKKASVEKLIPYLTSNNAVDLDSLLGSRTFVLGLAKGRKYGAELDAILNKHRDSGLIYQRASGDQSKGLIRMLLSDRRDIEGILGYPEEAQYVLKQSHFDDKQVVSYLVEGSPAYILGYMGCSKSSLGQTVIGQMESLIKENRAGKFAAFYQQWQAQANKSAHQQLLQQVFIDKPDESYQ